MTACTELDCGGTVAADGYCDTCGMKPSASRSVASGQAAPSASPASAVQAVPVAAGAACSSGCGGAIATDGYCDTCGLAAVPAAAPASVTPSVTGSSAPTANSAAALPSFTGPGVETSTGWAPTIAAPQAPATAASVASRTGTAAGQSRRTARSGRTATNRSAIGAGLITVASTPVGDPAQAVMSESKIRSVLGEVPEDERVCSNCGRPVGRATDDRPGRVKGFCGTCRTAFDFVTNEPALTAGEMVAGQYQILGPLAHGGMGWIYLGRDKAVSDRWVVLKGLLNDDDPDAAIAAVAERQFLAQIEHPNIVNIYNFVTHRGAGYIVMEMVGGESLNSKLKDRRKANGGVSDPLPPAEAIAYVLGILPAFGYLHSLGLVYNDLKPANIMAVGDDVKLIDVGAVMKADDVTAAIFGTQGFQAPEVAKDGPSVASDLFTVGRTLAVLMIRFVFHDGPYLYAVPPPQEEPLFAQWEALYRFLLRACAFHPDDRFLSAADMAEQLTGVLREVVAVTEGSPRSAPSEMFDADQLTTMLVSGIDQFDPSEPDARVLPRPRVDPEDPAAGFLASLPELDPKVTLELISAAADEGRVERSVELRFRSVREVIDAGGDGERLLQAMASEFPFDWRIPWYRGVLQLRDGNPTAAAENFSRVWTELPGEIAPRLAAALAAELAGEFSRAAQLYENVARVDASHVSAAFGLARCRRAMNDPDGVVDAFGLVPPSSAAHYDAQVAAARALVGGGSAGAPTLVDLTAAAETIDRLQLDAEERTRLSAEVYERALAGLQEGRIQEGSVVLIDRPLTERSIREGLEQTYREQARMSTDDDERVRLVDAANHVRPRTLF